MGLRSRLALITSLLTLAGLGLGLGITYEILLRSRLTSFDTESRILAQVISEAVARRADQGVSVPRVVESYLTDESGVSSAQVFLDGSLLWEGGVLDAPRPLDPAGLLVGRGGRSVAGWRVVTLAEPETGITVQVGHPLASTWETLRPFARLALPLMLTLALLVGVAAWWVVGVALRPLRTLTDAAEHFEDAHTVPVIAGRDEPARLARSFTTLLDRLTAERQRERSFLAHAAHELRTPLSALRAGLEAARTRGSPIGPDALARFHHEALRLETLSQNLLALSRSEAADLRVDALDLADLASAAYDRFQPLALEKGLTLCLEDAPAVVRGDARLLGQALDNLMSNALRCTTTGSVTIRTSTDSASVTVEVLDTGPGFSGSWTEGLGLRVARAVARVHGGQLELGGERGAHVALRLPPP